MRLNGKVAIVSGATRGLGEAQARLFADQGCKVIIGGRSLCDGNRVESEIRQSGGDCIFVPLEVTRTLDWDNAIDSAIRYYGKLDILVNNAGISVGSVDLESMSVELWDQVMDVNAKGVFLGMKHAIPVMRRSGGGSIINISSVAGLIGAWQKSPVYGASKACLLYTSPSPRDRG